MELKLTGQKRNTSKKLENPAVANKNNLSKQIKQSSSKSTRKNITQNDNLNIKDEDLSIHLNDLSLNNNTSTKKRSSKTESKQINTILTDKNDTTKNNNINSIKENRRIKVLKQLEFYFSDENLFNDKHLKNLILSNQENAVKIAEIGKFKRIKLLLKNFSDEDIFKYLQHTVKTFSTFLKLSTNGKSIKRVESFKVDNENIKELDKRTLYIENLPKHIFHDKIYDVFSQYGLIKHSSLPRHKESNQSKGFGFIIYNTIDEMNTAVKAFEKSFVPKEFKQEKYKGVLQPVLVMSKEDWLIRKNELRNLSKNCLDESKSNLYNSNLKPSNDDHLINDNEKVKGENIAIEKLSKNKTHSINTNSLLSKFVVEITNIRSNVNRSKMKNSILAVLNKNHSIMKINIINPMKTKAEDSGLEFLDETNYKNGVNSNFTLKCFIVTDDRINDENFILLQQKFTNCIVKRIDL